jgi:hypothetical protein
MIIMHRFGWVLLFTALAVTGSGCGSKDGLTKVQGIVTLNGKPVENAQVSFVPVRGGTGKPATGRTGPDGSFDLTTTRPHDGAMPGDYTVLVQYEEGTVVPPGSMKEAKAGLLKASKKPKPPPKYVIPAFYSDPAKTPLSQKVPPGGPVKLELKSK